MLPPLKRPTIIFHSVLSKSDNKNSSDFVREERFLKDFGKGEKKEIFETVRNGGSRGEARSGSRRHSYGIPIAHSPMAFPVPTTYLSFEIRSARGRGGGGGGGGGRRKEEKKRRNTRKKREDKGGGARAITLDDGIVESTPHTCTLLLFSRPHYARHSRRLLFNVKISEINPRFIRF